MIFKDFFKQGSAKHFIRATSGSYLLRLWMQGSKIMFVDILHAFGVTGLKIKKNWSLHASIRGSFWHGVRVMDYLFIWTTIIINQVSHISKGTLRAWNQIWFYTKIECRAGLKRNCTPGKNIFNLLLTFFPLAELIAVSNPGESRGNTIETILGNPHWGSFHFIRKQEKNKDANERNLLEKKKKLV